MLYRSAAAIGAALALLAFGSAAQAGVNATLMTVTGTPSTSTVGQAVTLTSTFDMPTSCTVAFTDGGNGNAALCTSTHAASATATCVASFPTPGVRTVTGTPAGGGCFVTTRTYSQTVNAVAPVPTVGEWTLWGMAGLFMLGGGAMLARRTRRFHA